MGQPPTTSVAPGKVNTIKDGPNMVRLPLGTRASDPKPTGTTTWFWVTIPTNTGGELTVTHEDGGTVEIYQSDGTTKLAGNGTSKAVHQVAAPFHGILYVLATGGKMRDVSAEFVQVSFAREGPSPKDKPLVPWNFYFWPASQVQNNGVDAREVLAKIGRFARAYKKDEDKAVDWERRNHQTTAASGWAGHCHNAAPASIMFEQPVATTVNNEKLSEDDLELLAAEWFGNYGDVDYTFRLNMGNAVLPDIYPPMAFKPAEPVTLDRLVSAIRAYRPAMDPVEVVATATAAFSKLTFAAEVKGHFGVLAARFYKTLLDEIRTAKHALIADLRGEVSSSSPVEVWNHAIFYFKAVFQENPVTQDPQDMLVKLNLVANADQHPSPGLPAQITNDNRIDVSGSFSQRKSIHLLRLVFSGGDIAESDSRNEWRSCKSSESGGELYVPDSMGRVRPVDPKTAASKVSNGSPLGLLAVGNPWVEREPVTDAAPALKLRKRYKK